MVVARQNGEYIKFDSNKISMTSTEGFYKKTPAERLRIVKELANLTDEETALIKNTGALEIERADMLAENVMGAAHLPLGIATNFIINGREVLVPMAIDEPSVIAAASFAAKLARPEGFTVSADEQEMIGQIQLVEIPSMDSAKRLILERKKEILKLAAEQDPLLVKYGGGVRDLEVRILETKKGKMMILHLIVNVSDAYGPNAVTTMLEAITPLVEEITKGKARIRMISNLAIRRLARAEAVWKREALAESISAVDMDGDEIIDAILDGYYFAMADQFRATTHNKGIMNGIDAVAIATSNDWRGIEAGAHSYAAITGKYLPLTKYEKDSNGNLKGSIELPIAVGVVGGAINTNPLAKVCLKILRVKSAKELAEIMAAVGLAQNFAAMRALCTEGIQRGHMKLHAKNIAIIAGAEGDLIETVAKQMAEEKKVTTSRAREILEELKDKVKYVE